MAYNLCSCHLNEENIKQHIEIVHTHSDTNNCKFVNWNDELFDSKELVRIEQLLKFTSE